MIKSALCVKVKKARRKNNKKKPPCEYLVLYFSIHSTDCINRWCLLGTSGYNWPSSFPVHFPASPWIFLLFPFNHSTLNSALSSAFLLLGTVLWTCIPTSSFNFIFSAWFRLELMMWTKTSPPKPNLLMSHQLEQDCSLPFTWSSGTEQERFFAICPV